MDVCGREDGTNFPAAAGEAAEANNEGPGSGGVLDDEKHDSETINPEAEPGNREVQSFAVDDDQDQILIADSTSSNNGLINESIETPEDLESQIDSSKMDTSSTTALSGDPTMASSNVLSDIAASSLLGSIATMIDSGSDCSLTDNSKSKDGLSLLESASTSSIVTTPTVPSSAVAAAPNPISLNLARPVQNTSLLVNGNSLLTGSAGIASLGTSLLNTPGLVQAISQQQTAPVTSAPTLRVAPAATPSPVTITVRTPPGTGALSQALISNIVNTPEVQALLAKNPGQPITIVRVPDAPATVANQASTPNLAAPPAVRPPVPTSAPAPAPAPAPPPPPVSGAILTPTPNQGSNVPLMKVVTNLTNKQQTPVRTFPPGTVLSNRLPNSNPKSSPSPSSTVAKSTPSPKPAIVLGVKKKVGRGGGKAGPKGMAPAVPSSQDFNLMRQKRPANCKTRSGRVSRPPLYRIKEYKTMSNEEMAEQPGSSEGEYSDYDETESLAHSLYNQKRKFKCQNCEKRYIGRGGLARHYRENPAHGDPDSVWVKNEEEDQAIEEVETHNDDKEKQEEKVDEPVEKTDESFEKTEDLVEKPDEGMDHSPTVEEEKPSSLKGTVVKDSEKTEPVKPKPAIITYHYTPRCTPYKPRGRGRGRPPGSGRKIVDQSGDAAAPNSKDIPKSDTSTSKFFDPKSPLDDDLVKVTLPMLSKIITPWEYTLASAQLSITKETLFPTILKLLKEMHSEAKKMALACLQPKSDSTKDGETQDLVIEDETIAKVLGVETGRYSFKDPPEDILPKTVKLLRECNAVSKEQKHPKVAEKVGEALMRKRAMASPLQSEPPTKKTPGTISILSPSRSSKSPITTTSPSPAKRVHTIGTIASIADLPSTTVKPAAKRPIPPLGPISLASKGLESNTTSVESSSNEKPTSVTSSLPPLKPIKTTSTVNQPVTSSSEQVSQTDTKVSTGLSPKGDEGTAQQLIGTNLDSIASTAQDADSNADRSKDASTSETPLLETTGDTPSEDLVEQTTVLPEGTTIMQLEDGTFLLQKPDGTAMQIQTPEGMTIETVQALLSMEGGAIETVEEPSPQYILDDGSCVQLPAGMSLDMAVEMGLINQSTD